jgi:hypothetical protein
VIVRDFDAIGEPPFPCEADSILVVDTDTVLPDSIPGQGLKTIPRRNGQLRQIPDAVNLVEFSSGDRPQIPWTGLPGRLRVNAIEYVGSAVPSRVLWKKEMA